MSAATPLIENCNAKTGYLKHTYAQEQAPAGTGHYMNSYVSKRECVPFPQRCQTAVPGFGIVVIY
ncbi:hypothetical protein FE236_00770 [Mariprofundus erugo]|uniref:hypothetical protein n=1 Tax=Mariprofundus erugo TaxID=2528639 RepID=UPI0010FE2216|nr:hypothetical protein [Mariprofundus erugo]TLS78322.1 hypothetical protein FE236_00770 [Mariprofundus erugo]